MHEFSIVGSLLDLCEKHAKENEAKKVLQVEIKVGKLSGIEPHLMKTAFDTFKEKTICEEAVLVMHLEELVLYCATCKQESVLDKNEFFCPKCQSTDVTSVAGEEMYLMRLEME